jgi:hypothetical protein
VIPATTIATLSAVFGLAASNVLKTAATQATQDAARLERERQILERAYAR